MAQVEKKFTDEEICEYVYPKLNVISGRQKDEPEGDYHIIVYTSLRQRHKSKWWLTHYMFRLGLDAKFVNEATLVYAAAQNIGEAVYRAMLFGKVDTKNPNTILDPDQTTEKRRLENLYKGFKVEEAPAAAAETK